MTELLEIKFSQEQAMLLDAATSFCRENSPTSQVRKLLETEQGFESSLWKQMGELGWPGIIVPEKFAGSGLSISDVVPIVEAMGQTLMDTPLVPSLLATQVIMLAGSEEQQSALLPQLSSGACIGSMALSEDNGSWELSDIETELVASGNDYVFSGTKTFVQHAPSADFIIASCLLEGQPTLVLLQKDQISSRLDREKVIDETRRSYRLKLDGLIVEKHALLSSGVIEDVLKELQGAATLLSAAEITGGIPGVMKVTLEYLNTRKQFGKLIGSYQGLKHPMAEILCDYDYARSLLYHAATIYGTGTEAEIAIRLAKAHAGDTFLHAADRAVQFHGGFGFTYECDAQLFLRRASWCQYYFGDSVHHRTHLSSLML